MPTLSQITKVGAFSNDVAAQINDNFTALNAASGTGAPTGTGAAVLATSPTITTPTITTPTITNPTVTTGTFTSPTLVTPALGVATATSVAASGKLVGASLNFVPAASETGANNALVAALAGGPALAAGVILMVQLAHSLQAGANTINYNGAGVKDIKSSRNAANNIGTAYAATGIINLVYDGTSFLDLNQ